jgi:hypothetical protein
MKSIKAMVITTAAVVALTVGAPSIKQDVELSQNTSLIRVQKI